MKLLVKIIKLKLEKNLKSHILMIKRKLFINHKNNNNLYIKLNYNNVNI